MADVLVRGIDEPLVKLLEERAAAHGRSVEQEVRDVLAGAMPTLVPPGFVEQLIAIPDVGDDADFERVQG